MGSKGIRALLLVLMDAIFVLAVIDVGRIVVRFFGSLAGSQVGEKFVELSQYLVVPIGIDPISTPYGGLFDVDAAVTVGVMLLVEAVLGMVRRRS